MRESLRGDLFPADSPWELGCVGGFVGSMNLVPRVRERVGEPLRMSLVGLCWYRMAKEAGGGEGGVPITHHADILYAITHHREKMTRECGAIPVSVHGNISDH